MAAWLPPRSARCGAPSASAACSGPSPAAAHPAQLGYVNGEPAILRFHGERLHSITTIEVVDGRIANVYSVLNPEKLPTVVTRDGAAASWE